MKHKLVLMNAGWFYRSLFYVYNVSGTPAQQYEWLAGPYESADAAYAASVRWRKSMGSR